MWIQLLKDRLIFSAYVNIYYQCYTIILFLFFMDPWKRENCLNKILTILKPQFSIENEYKASLQVRSFHLDIQLFQSNNISNIWTRNNILLENKISQRIHLQHIAWEKYFIGNYSVGNIYCWNSIRWNILSIKYYSS